MGRTVSSGSGGEESGRVSGEVFFQVQCASCHGPEGRGDGPSAVTLRPPPHDFAVRPWRSDPSRESIRKVILDGIPGTAMPGSRGTLAEQDLDSLVEHVYRLATAGPSLRRDLSPEARLLEDAGLVDLRGTVTPALTVHDAAGRVVKLADLEGRLVLLHFWGTGCLHCLKEMPHLRDLESSLAGRPFSVLHVCADADDVQQAQAVADRSSRGVRALVDESGISLARFEVQALPAVWLIGPDGRAIGRSQGARNWSDPALRAVIEHWLPARAVEGSQDTR
jgi:peroxiredoxin